MAQEFAASAGRRMNNNGSYESYASDSLTEFYRRDAKTRNLLVDSLGDRRIARVLDVGCGGGQELLPFLEKTDAKCVGLDCGSELAAVTAKVFDGEDRVSFVRGAGEMLPFEDGAFDVVLCRVALPYMDNRAAIAEFARVLAPDGVLLLKTHAPGFYVEMLRERAATFSPRMIAYPLICLAASVWHSLTGRQLSEGFWKGKEVFQTTAFLRREFSKHGLEIRGRLADDNANTPSYSVIKNAVARGFALAAMVAEAFV